LRERRSIASQFVKHELGSSHRGGLISHARHAASRRIRRLRTLTIDDVGYMLRPACACAASIGT
jgi:hypothetical protein